MKVFLARGVILPSLLLMTYSLLFTPYWVTYKGDDYGPVFGREKTVHYVEETVYTEEYHMQVYGGMAAVFVCGIAALVTVIAQFGFSFLPVQKQKASDSIHMFLSVWIMALQLGIMIAPAADELLEMNWAYYLSAIFGSGLALSNVVVAAVVLNSNHA